MSNSIDYRPDIDGLRAVAIVPVVLYHAKVPGFGGGFVGVDIFFVISGFLITTILNKEIAQGAFSIARFYVRRIRRIFPALFFMLATITILALIVLMPQDLESFGKHVAATTLFVSNFAFWTEAGYFDAAAGTKPLLHTWSLAVEEQFYILFPVFLLLFYRLGRRPLAVLTAALVALSFFLSLLALDRDVSAAFYLPLFRAWELGIGSLLGLGAIPQLKTALLRQLASIIGISMIIWSIVYVDATASFPGFQALPSVLGAALVIHSGALSKTPVSAILSLRPLCVTGLISYSLYLWHWPLLVLAEYYLIRRLEPVEIVLAITAAIVLSSLSWKYVETPFRRACVSWSTGYRVWWFAGSCMATAMLVGALFYTSGGFSNRFDPAISEYTQGKSERLEAEKRCKNWDGASLSVPYSKLCKIGQNSIAEPSFAIWGDSHALQYVAALDDLASFNKVSGLAASLGNCQPLLGVVRRDYWKPENCKQFNEEVLDILVRTPTIKAVVVAGIWAVYAEGTDINGDRKIDLFDLGSPLGAEPKNRALFELGLRRTIEALEAAGKKVYIMGPSPEIGWDVPTILERSIAYGRSPRHGPSLESYLERQQNVLKTLNRVSDDFGATVWRTDKVLCSLTSCPVRDEEGLLYFDSNHLTRLGAARVLNQYADSLFKH